MARRHALSALKNFGVLAGETKKRAIRPRPGVETTLFAGRLARLEGLTDWQTLESRWFRLLGLDTEQIVELFHVAHGAWRLRIGQRPEGNGQRATARGPAIEIAPGRTKPAYAG